MRSRIGSRMARASSGSRSAISPSSLESAQAHRHLLALTFQCGARGENFFRKMLWRVVLGRGEPRLPVRQPSPGCGRGKGRGRRKLRAAFGAEFCRSGIVFAARGANARQRRAAFGAEFRRLRHACVAARALHRCIQDDRAPPTGCNSDTPFSSDREAEISVRPSADRSVHRRHLWVRAPVEYKRCAQGDLRRDNGLARIGASRDPARLECRS